MHSGTHKHTQLIILKLSSKGINLRILAHTHVTWLLWELLDYRETCCLIDLQYQTVRSERWGGGGGGGEGGWICKCLYEWWKMLQLQYLWKHVEKNMFFLYISWCPHLLLHPTLLLLTPVSSVWGPPLSLALSLSLFLSDCLCLSATLSVVGIHHLSWAATSCDPPAKNQTALPTARRAHKETRMLIQTHTHNWVTHTQCHKEKRCSIRPPETQYRVLYVTT